jgi:cytochrome b6-f complex iron-sulfur subunit
MKPEEQSRRQFCAGTCRMASLAALGGLAAALEACGGGSPTSPGGGGAALPIVNAQVSGTTITVDTAGTPLATNGTLALVRTSAGDVLVARTGAGSFVALSANCTHQRCEITAYSGQEFVCPCHGSRFDASGRVVQGPAPASLPVFQTQLAGDVLTITP